jgi:hypothetical protein
MKKSYLILLTLLMSVFFSCEKTKQDTFTDKLTFGTSVNYSDFTLVGEGSSFSISPGNVAFRLESSEEFVGNSVKFVINKDGIKYSTEIYSNNPKPTGHIFITTLNYGLKGSYSVSAYIVKSSGDQSVASGNFQMN